VTGIPQHLAHRDMNPHGVDAEEFKHERRLEANHTQPRAMEQNFVTVGVPYVEQAHAF
jgi:hypothetical protein